MKPSVGRIVHYVSRGSADGKFPKTCRAAIITQVDEWEARREELVATVAKAMEVPEDLVAAAPGHPVVSLCVLNPTGMFFQEHCAFDPGKPVEGWVDTYTADYAPGTWHWPERVE